MGAKHDCGATQERCTELLPYYNIRLLPVFNFGNSLLRGFPRFIANTPLILSWSHHVISLDECL